MKQRTKHLPPERHWKYIYIKVAEKVIFFAHVSSLGFVEEGEDGGAIRRRDHKPGIVEDPQ